MHLSDDGATIAFVRDIFPQEGIAFEYSPPLPYVMSPLRAGMQRMVASVTLFRLVDGQAMARGTVEYALEARRPQPESPMPGRQFDISTERRLKLPGKVIGQHGESRITAGIGEVDTWSITDNGIRTSFLLLCTTVSGRWVVDCDPGVLRELGEQK